MQEITTPLAKKRRSLAARLVSVSSWITLATFAMIATLLHAMGDSSWLLALFTFGPRWIVFLPLIPLFGAALALRRRAIIPLSIAAWCGLVPIMGYCIPRQFGDSNRETSGLSLSLISLNVGGIKQARLEQFLAEVDADIFAFQECPVRIKLPRKMQDEWQSAQYGELRILSRFPIEGIYHSEVGPSRSSPPIIRCDIRTPAGTIHVHCVHLFTLRKGLDAVIAEWWRGAPELERVTAIRNEDSRIAARFAKATNGPVVIAGDFNLTSESRIFHGDWSGWNDAFALRGFGFGYTFATQKIGLRIDHVLADPLHWRIRSCRVGADLKGQHRPVIAELELTAPLAGSSPRGEH